jgi:hypothetical protein
MAIININWDKLIANIISEGIENDGYTFQVAIAAINPIIAKLQTTTTK